MQLADSIPTALAPFDISLSFFICLSLSSLDRASIGSVHADGFIFVLVLSDPYNGL
jgi:hypothetical protein